MSADEEPGRSEPGRSGEQDPMEESFDQLRLRASQLRMISEEGHQRAAEVDTGSTEIDALLRDVLSTLTDRTAELAEDVDRNVEYFHPLYLEDKRQGRAGPGRDDDHA